jgi:hypothetical protein
MPPCSHGAVPTAVEHYRCSTTTRTTAPLPDAPPLRCRRAMRWCTPVARGYIRVLVVFATGLANIEVHTTPYYVLSASIADHMQHNYTCTVGMQGPKKSTGCEGCCEVTARLL